MSWKRFHRLNIWFDQLNGDVRFYYFLILIICLLAVPHWIFGEVGYLFGMTIFCILGIYRINYHQVNHKIVRKNSEFP